MDGEQERAQAAVALLTAWLEDADGTSEFPATLVADLAVALGEGDDLHGALVGALSLVAGLTSVAGQLLVLAARANGTSEEEQLQSLSLLYA